MNDITPRLYGGEGYHCRVLENRLDLLTAEQPKYVFSTTCQGNLHLRSQAGTDFRAEIDPGSGFRLFIFLIPGDLVGKITYAGVTLYSPHIKIPEILHWPSLNESPPRCFQEHLPDERASIDSIEQIVCYDVGNQPYFLRPSAKENDKRVVNRMEEAFTKWNNFTRNTQPKSLRWFYDASRYINRKLGKLPSVQQDILPLQDS
ncbi:hypothetical protein HYV86_00250 [Candidatus Woesearchaeota archaeon]|nr:hypothetical protein [Candidatus Woesearchaeota archaeon]